MKTFSKNFLSISILFFGLFLLFPKKSLAANGIFPSSVSDKYIGDVFEVTVNASGAEFNTIEGLIEVKGPATIVSFTANTADNINWMTGLAPVNNKKFTGVFLGTTKTNYKIATIKLKATAVGKIEIVVRAAKLYNAGKVVGAESGTSVFNVIEKPVLILPAKVIVKSSSHPDQTKTYPNTNILLNWNKDSGVSGFSYILDNSSKTEPKATIVSDKTQIDYANKNPGIYYFHIKAKNKDGWSVTTHYKINIASPESSEVIEPLQAETTETNNLNNQAECSMTIEDILVSKDSGFTSNTETFKNLLISGKTAGDSEIVVKLINNSGNFEITGKSDNSGLFSIVSNKELIFGIYKLEILAKKQNCTATENSVFEATSFDGGGIHIISGAIKTPNGQVKGEQISKETIKTDVKNKSYRSEMVIVLVASVFVVLSFFFGFYFKSILPKAKKEQRKEFLEFIEEENIKHPNKFKSNLGT